MLCEWLVQVHAQLAVCLCSSWWHLGVGGGGCNVWQFKKNAADKEKALFQLVSYTQYASLQTYLERSRHVLLVTACGAHMTASMVAAADAMQLKQQAYDVCRNPLHKMRLMHMCYHHTAHWNCALASHVLDMCAQLTALSDDSLVPAMVLAAHPLDQ